MLTRFALLLPAAALLACGSSTPEVVGAETTGPTVPGATGKADSSAVAIFLDFEFDSELLAQSCYNPEGTIEDQMLFTIGQLNGVGGVGRIDRLAVSNVQAKNEAGGCKITYHGRMPVAWPKSTTTPATYTLLLPKDLNYAGQERFAKTYTGCVEHGAHDVSAGNFWYYYRPAQSGCKLADADIVKAKATVFPSAIQTTGKYPEYHEIWEDNRFEVVAIFGKYEDGATSGDAGISAYDSFSKSAKQLAAKDPAFILDPPDLALNPGVKQPKFTVTADLGGGRSLQIKGFLVDNIREAPQSFWDEYETLTPKADFIVYNGHAGLGSNVRKLAEMGKWVTGQYVIVFQNGCDTYAYISDALTDSHAAVNPDDPDGTKHLDMVANARPSFFHSMPAATMAIVNALVDPENPKTYEQIFRNIDSSEVVLVTGESDNVYVPGYTGGETPAPVETWKGLDEKGTVAANQEARFETPVLPAGRYTFELSGSGDGDLYVRVGEAPTESTWECRPYADGSDETCEVSLNTPAPVHVMVRGYADTSDFQLIGE